jgi:hypothetical protein
VEDNKAKNEIIIPKQMLEWQRKLLYFSKFGQVPSELLTDKRNKVEFFV